jgi:hypothetical protein
LPADLRRRVAAVCEGLDDAKARAAFGIRSGTLRRWRSPWHDEAKEPAFTVLEMSPPPGLAEPGRGEVRLVISAADGRSVQIAGALRAEDIALIVRGLVG